MSLQLLRGARPESRADAVARRFRGAVAELSMTKAEVARRLGKPETWVGRRASGSTSFTLDDLDAIEAVIGISANYLFTGVNEENRHPDNPNGGYSAAVHPPGLEPGTH